MRHVSSLLIKFIIVALVIAVVLNTLTTITLAETMLISAAVTIIAYIIGDLLILPTTNNTVATFADVGLSLLIIYMFNFIWNTIRISFIHALITAAVIGVGEWFFHKYVVTSGSAKNKVK
jgi:uncharacterized membrane protein